MNREKWRPDWLGVVLIAYILAMGVCAMAIVMSRHF